MMKIVVPCVLLITAVSACHKKGTDAMNNADREFMERTAYMHHAAIQLGEVAISKGSEPFVRSFAQMDIAAHTAEYNELQALADKRNYKLPGNMDLEHQGQKEVIQGKDGRNFDSVYMRGQTLDHDVATDIFDDELNKGSDQGIKDYATKYKATMKAHFNTADSFSVVMKYW